MPLRAGGAGRRQDPRNGASTPQAPVQHSAELSGLEQKWGLVLPIRDAARRVAPGPRGARRPGPFMVWETERQVSFFLNGGLAVVHSSGRDRDAIWNALERKEVYGTSGPRPQHVDGESVDPLIEDPWPVFPCAADPAGCHVAFSDHEFRRSGRDTLYYARAIEARLRRSGRIRSAAAMTGKDAASASTPASGDLTTTSAWPRPSTGPGRRRSSWISRSSRATHRTVRTSSRRESRCVGRSRPEEPPDRSATQRPHPGTRGPHPRRP